MATYQNGGVRTATANTVTAMKRSAETRRCPKCGRKSALTWHRGEFVSVRYCQWSRPTYRRDRLTGVAQQEHLCTYDVAAVIRERIARGFDLPAEHATERRFHYELEALL